MKRKYFITQQQIHDIIRFYGSRRYRLSAKYHSERDSIVFTEKNNDCLWLTIRRNDKSNKIEVRFTDESGVIVRREYWEIIDKRALPCRLE